LSFELPCHVSFHVRPVDPCNLDISRLVFTRDEADLDKFIAGDIIQFYNLLNNHTITCPDVSLPSGMSSYLIVFRPLNKITINMEVNENATDCDYNLNHIVVYQLKKHLSQNPTQQFEAYKYKFETPPLPEAPLKAIFKTLKTKNYLLVFMRRKIPSSDTVACQVNVYVNFTKILHREGESIKNVLHNTHKLYYPYGNDLQTPLAKDKSWNEAYQQCKTSEKDSLMIFFDYKYLLDFLSFALSHVFHHQVPIFIGAKKHLVSQCVNDYLHLHFVICIKLG